MTARTCRRLLASLLTAAALATAGQGVTAGEPIDWAALRPPAAAEVNPFAALTADQTDRLSELAYGQLLEQRGLPVTPAMRERRAELSRALQAEGLDAQGLLRAREVLIAKRQAASEGAVPELEAREVRLVGYLVPATDDARTLTDFLFVPWAGACSHTPAPPANQIVRIDPSALPGVTGSPFEPLLLHARLHIRPRQTRLILVDGPVTIASTYAAEQVRIEALPRPPERPALR